MVDALLPTWARLYAPKKSAPFRKPADPTHSVAVPKPMDLSTIKTKLTTGQYANPWEYIDDVWLMLENAWNSNKTTTKIYMHATKVSRTFNLPIPNEVFWVEKNILKLYTHCILFSYHRFSTKLLMSRSNRLDTVAAKNIHRIHSYYAAAVIYAQSRGKEHIDATQMGGTFTRTVAISNHHVYRSI